MKKDFFSGIFCILIGVFLWLTIPISIPHDDQLTQMGPRFFPAFLSLVLTGLGVVLSIQAYPWKKEWNISRVQNSSALDTSPEGQVALTKKDEAKVVLLFGIMILSCVLFSLFRYIVAMSVSATAILALYNEKKWSAYVSLYIFIILFYFIFAKLMYVQL